MSEDEFDIDVVEVYPTNPMAYAFEPVRKKPLKAFPAEEAAPGEHAPGEDRAGNTAWCLCGRCSPMPSAMESVCCREANIDNVVGGFECVTLSQTYRMVCRERDVLEVAMLSLREVRAETLVRPIDSRLFRLTAYRQFSLWARGYLGRRNRVPIPACVVTSIRAEFPSPEYHGFEYWEDDHY